MLAGVRPCSPLLVTRWDGSLPESVPMCVSPFIAHTSPSPLSVRSVADSAPAAPGASGSVGDMRASDGDAGACAGDAGSRGMMGTGASPFPVTQGWERHPTMSSRLVGSCVEGTHAHTYEA